MNYLTLENISLSYGEKVLFENLNLKVNQGEKIAIVARNGSGKSSLLRIVAGIDSPEGESSSYWINKDIQVAYLTQDPEFSPGHNILETILEGHDDWILPLKALYTAQKSHDDAETQKALALIEESKAWEIEAYVRELAGKFKLPDFDFPVDKLSGGQKKRLAIVKVLCGKPEFLIMDEPTNHLDLEMIEWLEKYLEQSQASILMVTHDRYFLNNVCNQILELDRGTLYKYQGDYEEFLEKKAMRMQNETVVKDKMRKMLKRELEWVRRMPKARTTKSKSRVDNFYENKESLEGPKEAGEIEFDIDHTRLGSKILELHNVSKSFGEKTILDKFSYKFKSGDRVGLVGPNGIGKTSLLKLFTGSLKPDSGKIIIGETVLFGYYEQDGLNLQEDKRVIDVIRSIADYIPLKKGHKLSAESLLEKFLFPRPQQQVYVSQLSGGERRRLYLLTILIKNPNFLILDEPTNDLDITTLNVLEDFLMEFPGVLLIVSHDRFFMDKLVQHLFVLQEGGKTRDFPGNYSEYREALKKESLANASQEKTEKTTTENAGQKERKINQAAKKEMQQIERELEKLSAERSRIIDNFATLNPTSNEFINSNKRLVEIQDRMDVIEMRWMEIVEEN
ncbi:MAG: ABC-F family ATP-binding cassette domain-containing protein [Saprospiraceae bacterium]|nr:ABC-F family ATP-binding cassette domain-containing protein [Candidatus Vicinibacter affinis]